jgi:hypothetical protein
LDRESAHRTQNNINTEFEPTASSVRTGGGGSCLRPRCHCDLPFSIWTAVFRIQYPANHPNISVLLGSETSKDDIIWSGYLTYEATYYTICLHYYIASYHASGKVAINCCYPANKASRYITMQHDTGDTIEEEIGWELSVFLRSEDRERQIAECLVA